MKSKEKNYYSINMQKILFVAKELHQRGYEKLRVEPSVAPTGLAWRCRFFVNSSEEKQAIIVSTWIGRISECDSLEITKPINELTDLFEKENMEFLVKCKGESHEYVEWFSKMINKLQEEELPYAFAEYFSPDDYWETTLNNKIRTLPNENRYNYD